MMSMMLLAAALGPATPQAAAIHFLKPRMSHVAPGLRVVARTRRYAIVHYNDALIESSRGFGQILTKKFSFGWQAIDVSAEHGTLEACTLRQHGIPNEDVAVLRHVLSDSTQHCQQYSEDQRDIGPQRDVDAVRAESVGLGEIIPFVRVIGKYAFVEWWGFGGGENFFRKSDGEWKQFAGSGGAFTVADLVAKGVPKSIAAKLLKR